MSNVRAILDEALDGARAPAILCCGSQIRGDDAAGMSIAEGLSGHNGQVKVFSGSNAPENLTGEIKKSRPDTLLVFDAAEMGLLPGETAIVTPDRIDGVSFSTHILPLKIMLDYLRSEIGCRIVLIGIQGASYEFGADLTPEVKNAVDIIVDAILDAYKTGSAAFPPELE